ncbi:MAG: GDP-mannose 4,6-dehydratase [Dehalococcoidia bacterium]
MPTALITGITGQDGSYLAEHLLSEGYAVYGLVRGQANPRRPLMEAMLPDVQVLEGDLLDQTSLINAVQRCQPDEVYNLAAISYVPLSWNQAELTAEITGLGVLRMLEAIRLVTGATPSRPERVNGIKFYQASSSEMFGKVRESPQNEHTGFYPRSPYGVAKVYGHYITVNYRESYGLFACSGILFNHESPRRGEDFVTRKLSLAASRVKLGKQSEVTLGNLESKRDWGYAPDYVRAMHMMLQQDEPDDYVIGTGEAHSPREFAELAFKAVGLNYEDYVVGSDPRHMRPADVDHLLADPSKAREKLGWEPSVTFQELARLMVEADLQSEAKAS